jgi:hypothetical protein
MKWEQAGISTKMIDKKKFYGTGAWGEIQTNSKSTTII